MLGWVSIVVCSAVLQQPCLPDHWGLEPEQVTCFDKNKMCCQHNIVWRSPVDLSDPVLFLWTWLFCTEIRYSVLGTRAVCVCVCVAIVGNARSVVLVSFKSFIYCWTLHSASSSDSGCSHVDYCKVKTMWQFGWRCLENTLYIKPLLGPSQNDKVQENISLWWYK